MMIHAQDGEHLRLQSQHLRNTGYLLGAGSARDVVTECRIEGCDIEVTKQSGQMLHACRLIDCSIRNRSKSPFLFGRNYWEGCRFTGHFVGTYFMPMEASEWTFQEPFPAVTMRGCDFSKATMAGNTICGLDVPSTTFPVWPCFTILRPQEHTEEWRAATAPLGLRFLPNLLDSADVRDAMMFHWPLLMKWYKVSNAPDEFAVRQVLASLKFVRL